MEQRIVHLALGLVSWYHCRVKGVKIYETMYNSCCFFLYSLNVLKPICKSRLLSSAISSAYVLR